MIDPLLIHCEGSGCPTHLQSQSAGMCSMCGRFVIADGDGNASDHQREDILAMLRRGDYG
jgi:hypothetical protein